MELTQTSGNLSSKSAAGPSVLTFPLFYLNSSIPSYSGKEPLKKTTLTTHQKRALYYIHLLESEHPIPILSNQIKRQEQERFTERFTERVTERTTERTETSKNLYFHTNYAFYADPICTGKSFVILSLLSLHPYVERKQLLTIWSNGLGMNVFSKIENFEIPLSLLVVPHSSIGQWNMLLQQETNIRYFIVDSESSIDLINTYEHDLLLVADIVFDKVCQHFEGFCVSRIIFDDLLHLEISPNPTSFDPSLFGNLRSSFTWFICSEPEMCLQKYKHSRLPFATLIKQMFSFPHPGLIFRNEYECLEQSLSCIVPKVEISHINVYLEKVSPNPINVQQEIKDLLLSDNLSQTYQHLISLLTFQLNIKFKTIDQYINSNQFIKFKEENLSIQKIETILERYKIQVDPITYNKIKYPVILNCCHQIYDLITLCKCFVQDLRCPYCRKECLWTDIVALDENRYNLDKDIFELIRQMDFTKYNIIYMPSFYKANGNLKDKMNRMIRETFKNYKCFIWNGKSNSKKTFDEFKKEKGILFITKPIESNLHLSFIDEVYVLHPKNYICKTFDVWYTNYFKKTFEHLIPVWESRSSFPLSDQELGNFCIGRKSLLNIKFLSFL